jgi:predicted ATPase
MFAIALWPGEKMIERIYVHNFRCFEDFTLDLSNRGSVLIIGMNRTGKSTLKTELERMRDRLKPFVLLWD